MTPGHPTASLPSGATGIFEEQHVSRLVRPIGALTTAGALVLALGGVAAAKDVSNERYAKRICAELAAVDDGVAALDELDTSDLATYQAEALAAVSEVTASTKAAAAKLKRMTPDDGGKPVTKLFGRYLKEYVAGLEQAKRELAATDPGGADFSGDVTVFTVAIDNVPIELDDPFTMLTDHQDLLGAFGDEPSCRGIVEVTGG